MQTWGECFDPADLENIKAKLATADDNKLDMIANAKLRKPTLILIFSIVCWGVDRILLGQTVMGIVKILTCGGCWVWGIIDLISYKKRTFKYNAEKMNEFLG